MVREIFDLPSILQAAADAEETNDFWGTEYREALEVLVPSMADEAGLYPARAWRVVRSMLEVLGMRANIAKWLRAHPEARLPAIRRPIFITGLPRTGTTMLHNLLAGLPGHRGFTPWQMQFVVPPQDADENWEEDAIRDTDQEIRALYERAPEFAKIHPIHVQAPDECHWLMRTTCSSLFFSYLMYTPSYARWLSREPRHRAYHEYRVMLQILRTRYGDGRLVMKDPAHLWHIDELLDTFADALIVRLHRDPREVVPSFCSLMFALQRMDSTRVDSRDVGPYALEMLEIGMKREERVRSRRGGESFFDVDYRDLVRDPEQIVAQICSRAGEEFGEEHRASVRHWLASHPQHKAGKHVYSAEQFGLNPAQLVERLGERG